ncbi:UNVERIFIED_CONTAM: cytochrome [Sesamum radiatum]|uniref:Cytochrome n=2 Tax=Sesamum radiatum TaxID=300843 RepID=A0AAW2JK81_SESRA
MSSYEFSTRNLREFSSGVFKNNAAKLARIVSAAVTPDQTIEIQDLFMKSALDSVFKVVLGVDLDSMRGTNEGSQFSKAFDEASEKTCFRYVDMTWPMKKFLNIGSEATLKKCMKIVDGFVYKVIQSKIEQISKPNENLTVNKGDILSRFLEMNETDPKYLKDIILSFIIAGKDTTASTLSWFFYMMCKHPHIQEKIVREVREAAKLGEYSSVDEIAESITEEALDKMQYLHAALSETLRLYPAVPSDGKVCFSDDTFPDGFSVKKGNLVAYVPYSMGRMKSLWGEDAEEFRPERWLNENGVFQQESSFKFTAFQAGPRICLGKEFAYRQMKVFASVLLSAFSFTLADENRPVHYRTMLTLQIDGGLHLRPSFRTSH